MPPKQFVSVNARMSKEKRDKFDKKLIDVGTNRNAFLNAKIEEFIISVNGTEKIRGAPKPNDEGHSRLEITVNGKKYIY